jgi:predicted PhzF superfamily epimerase YddE/YHI9
VLACFWADRLASTALVGFQASHRPGRLDIELHGDRVSIAGRAVTVARGMITPAAAPAPA